MVAKWDVSAGVEPRAFGDARARVLDMFGRGARRPVVMERSWGSTLVARRNCLLGTLKDRAHMVTNVGLNRVYVGGSRVP